MNGNVQNSIFVIDKPTYSNSVMSHNQDDRNAKINGIDPLQRLPSLKPKRDLSLGGMKPNKKIFTPNLNVSRNKTKQQSTKNAQKDQKKDDKGRKDRRNDKNKNFKNGSNVIKSGGVFSEGVGSGERHNRSSAFSRDTESAAALQKPTLRVKQLSKINKDLEEQKLKAVVGEGWGDEDVSEDFKRSLDLETPIKLPMDDGSWSHSQPKPAVAVKQEVVIKQEPDDFDIIDSTLRDVKPPPCIKKETFEDTDLIKILRREDPTLILVQLPDTLPGRGRSGDDGPRRRTAEPAASAADESSEQVEDKCQLSQLEEGKIGKLLIHRSGRVMLALGDTLLEVSSGTPTAFLQQVVSLGVEDNTRTAHVVALGSLRHKLCAAPDWPRLLRDLPY